MSSPETETMAPHPLQLCQAVVCIVCHQITISLAVGGSETVSPSVQMMVLKHMAPSCFFIRHGICVRVCEHVYMFSPFFIALEIFKSQKKFSAILQKLCKLRAAIQMVKCICVCVCLYVCVCMYKCRCLCL